MRCWSKRSLVSPAVEPLRTAEMSGSRWPLAALSLLVGVALGAAGVWYLDQLDNDSDETVSSVEVATTTAVAQARDLVSYEEWSGTLSSGTTATVSASSRGTLTRTIDVGDTIELGDAVAEVDGLPVIALYGTVPQFRELELNADDGADIRQLEENLVALGYDPDGTVTVDENYTVNTGLMVQRWELDLGFDEPDTIVSVGQIAFIEGPSEVLSRVPTGSQMSPGLALMTTILLAESTYVTVPENTNDVEALVAGGLSIDDDAEIVDTVLDLEGAVEAGRPVYRTERAQERIELAVSVDETDTFPIGQAVEIELPDSQLILAEVTDVSDVARAIQSGQDTVTVVDITIQPLDELDTSFSSGPVTIRVEDDAVLGATMVPVRALVALAEGGHSIDVEGRGLVAVELGAFDDGWVEITNGAINPGETVVVPA